MIADKPDNKAKTEKESKNPDVKKVSGIGGIFFKCKDPEKLKEWYKTHLGFNTNQYGTRFEWVECPDINEGIQWSPFPETANYFAPSNKEFMINYRVDNLDYLVAQLKKGGVEFVDSTETYEYGKFVHIMDIEGNKIELYEPNYDFGKKED
ncbi:MAG: VOC family protein [Chlorobi bacterium]|nr:VOC family protein [Chlorobiota bacterium]